MQIEKAQCLASRRPLFGRRSQRAEGAIQAQTSAAEDLRLFALTFVGGFLFMAVYLA